MHHRTIEQLAAGDSPIHRLDPRVKLVVALTFVLALGLLPGWPPQRLAPLAGLVVLGLALARLPWSFVLGRTALLLPFVGLMALLLPLTRGQHPLVHWEALDLVVYREGSRLAAVIGLKAVLAILAVGWCVWTTPFGRLLLALRALRVPRVIVAVLGFLFRYLDLLADEGLRVRRARRARSPGRIRRWRLRSTGGLVGRLLLRTLDRAERVHRAMLARGYDGEVRDLGGLTMVRRDWFFAAVAGSVLAPVLVLAWLWGRAG